MSNACNAFAAVYDVVLITAGIDVRMREADSVTGVCVTGGGSGGAIAHGHAGSATGEAGSGAPDCSWWQQQLRGWLSSTSHTTAAAPAKPDNCATSASARKKRLI